MKFIKNILKYSLLLISFAVLNTSCDKNEVADLGSTENYPTLKITALEPSINNTTVNESDAITLNYKAEISRMFKHDVEVRVKIVSGTADDDDFTFVKTTIPAFSTEPVFFSVTVVADGKPESTETVKFEAGIFPDPDSNDFSHYEVKCNNFVTNLTINDCQTCWNDSLDFTMSWDKQVTFTIPGGTATFNTKMMDFDMLIFDQDFNMMDVYDGATGSHPEKLSFAGLPDGTYFLVADLYENNAADYGANESVDLRFTWNQEYFNNSGSFTFSGFNTDDSSGTEVVATVVKSEGHLYVVTP